MILPVQTTYRNAPHTDVLDALVREEADKLDRFFQGIVSCRVLVEQAHRHHLRGAAFHVRIELGVPGEELVISSDPDVRKEVTDDPDELPPRFSKSSEVDAAHKDAELAVRDAFRKAARRLQDYARRKTGAVKIHEPLPAGEVVKLFEAYGFLRSTDGREIYFHRNSVLHHGFDALRIGSQVTFVEEEGEKGPQASTVYP